MEIDLRQLAQSALKYWWLVVFLPLAVGVLAFLYTSRQDSLYRAEASLEVRASAVNDNAYDVLLGSERQARTYRVPVPATATGAVDVSVRLRFRSFPPYKARAQGKGDLVAQIPIFEMADDARTVLLQ